MLCYVKVLFLIGWGGSVVICGDFLFMYGKCFNIYFSLRKKENILHVKI